MSRSLRAQGRARCSPAERGPPTSGALKALFARLGVVVEAAGQADRRRGCGLWCRARVLGAPWPRLGPMPAIRHGIPAAQAATLVAETMAGTAALLTQTDTLALRRGVTSPGRIDRPRAGRARARRRARRLSRPRWTRWWDLMEAREQIAGLPRRADRRLHADHLRLDHRVLGLLASACACRTRARSTPCWTSCATSRTRTCGSSAAWACSSARSTSARSSRSWCCTIGGRIIVNLIDPGRERGAGRRCAPRCVAVAVVVADQVAKAIVRAADLALRGARAVPRHQARSTPATPASPSACSPAAGRWT